MNSQTIEIDLTIQQSNFPVSINDTWSCHRKLKYFINNYDSDIVLR